MFELLIQYYPDAQVWMLEVLNTNPWRRYPFKRVEGEDPNFNVRILAEDMQDGTGTLSKNIYDLLDVPEGDYPSSGAFVIDLFSTANEIQYFGAVPYVAPGDNLLEGIEDVGEYILEAMAE